MVAGRSQQALMVGVAADDPVQDHQVGRLHRSRVLGQILDAPADAALGPHLPRRACALLLVAGGEFRVLDPRRARLRQRDLDLQVSPSVFTPGARGRRSARRSGLPASEESACGCIPFTNDEDHEDEQEGGHKPQGSVRREQVRDASCQDQHGDAGQPWQRPPANDHPQIDRLR
jgi:hypothetical protein